MNRLEAIKHRRSVRTFSKDLFEKETEEILVELMEQHSLEKGPLGNGINLFEIEVAKGRQLGTYGIIRNPQKYIAGVCDDNHDALIDFGYLFEKMILDLFIYHVGTCWMAGTFKRESFEAHVEKGRQIMPAVSPIGYIEPKRVFETVMRKMVKADKRQPFEKLFFKENFQTPLIEVFANLHLAPLHAVRLAPSASNKQPWRILVKDDTYHLYLEGTPKYNDALGFKVQLIDMGIAMSHLEIACKAQDENRQWLKDDPCAELPNENYEYIISYK